MTESNGRCVGGDRGSERGLGTESDKETERKRLRREVLARRLALPEETRHSLSLAIARHLKGTEAYLSSQNVLAYASFRHEVDTAPIVADVRRRGKRLVLPRVDCTSRSLSLYAVQDPETDLLPGYQGILEPHPGCPRVEPGQIDLVLVPGLVFDRRGYRLGYGGGYYDRLLALMPEALRVGLAFCLQVVDRLPELPHDQGLDILVCERGVLYFRR